MATHKYRATDSVSALDTVERRLGPEAYILSLDWEGDEVVVLASDQPVPARAISPHESGYVATWSEPKLDRVRPKFLDPKAPKPFPAKESDLSELIVSAAHNSGAVGHSAVAFTSWADENMQPDAVAFKSHRTAMAEKSMPVQKTLTQAAEDIVFITLDQSDLFEQCLALSHLVPFGRLVHWRHGEVWPSASRDTERQRLRIILAAATHETLSDMICMAAHSPGVAVVHVVPTGKSELVAELVAAHLSHQAGSSENPNALEHCLEHRQETTSGTNPIGSCLEVTFVSQRENAKQKQNKKAEAYKGSTAKLVNLAPVNTKSDPIRARYVR